MQDSKLERVNKKVTITFYSWMIRSFMGIAQKRPRDLQTPYLSKGYCYGVWYK